jgi:hypothetical protein
MWWEHYKSMQQPEYEITWGEFKKAFRDHHLPKALTDRKMRVIGSQARVRHGVPIRVEV